MVWRIKKVEKNEKNGMGKMGTPNKGILFLDLFSFRTLRAQKTRALLRGCIFNKIIKQIYKIIK